MQADDDLVLTMIKVMFIPGELDVELLCTGCGTAAAIDSDGAWPSVAEVIKAARVHAARCPVRPRSTTSDICPVHGQPMLQGHPGEWLCVCTLDGGGRRG